MTLAVALALAAHLVHWRSVRRDQDRCGVTTWPTFCAGLCLLAVDGFVITLFVIKAGW